MKYEYFNQCDKWRIEHEHGESNWQQMMANRVTMTGEQFGKVVDYDTFFDPDDSEDNIENYMMEDENSNFYRSKINNENVIFFQVSGFEFIFTEDGKEPGIGLIKSIDEPSQSPEF